MQPVHLATINHAGPVGAVVATDKLIISCSERLVYLWHLGEVLLPLALPFTMTLALTLVCGRSLK